MHSVQYIELRLKKAVYMKPEIKVIRTDSHGNKNGLNQLITVKETATSIDCTEQTVGRWFAVRSYQR